MGREIQIPISGNKKDALGVDCLGADIGKLDGPDEPELGIDTDGADPACGGGVLGIVLKIDEDALIGHKIGKHIHKRGFIAHLHHALAVERAGVIAVWRELDLDRVAGCYFF